MTEAAVTGVRARLVERVQEPIARHTPLSTETVRALFGAAFLVLAVRTVVRAVRAGVRA